jgi:hypothetical protein
VATAGGQGEPSCHLKTATSRTGDSNVCAIQHNSCHHSSWSYLTYIIHIWHSVP